MSRCPCCGQLKPERAYRYIRILRDWKRATEVTVRVVESRD